MPARSSGRHKDTMPPGRPPKPIEYTDLTFSDGKTYTVGKVHFKDEFVRFIIDTDDKAKVLTRNWHVVTGAYIGCYVNVEGVRKTLYLHNFILDRLTFDGKGQESTIDHINGIGYDNRRCNLREISQSLQNMNTRNRERKTDKLPEGFDIQTIPRNIWYIPPCGSHGDRFAVEFKGIPGVDDIVWKTTSSKSVDIHTKLESAIEKKNEIIQTYPVLLEFSRTSQLSEKLVKEYHEIIATA